jgi:hypothetical protein
MALRRAGGAAIAGADGDVGQSLLRVLAGYVSVGHIVRGTCMRQVSRLRALAVFGLCLTLMLILYLMLSYPEESVAWSADHLREMAVASAHPSDQGHMLEAILMNLDYVAGVEVHLLRVILSTLVINTIVFILVLVVSARIKRAIAPAIHKT